MSNTSEPAITSGQLEFDADGNLINVTYVNPKTQKVIICKVNPHTGEISKHDTIEGKVEFDNNGDLIKITYFNPVNIALPKNNDAIEERSKKSLCLCKPGILQNCPCP